MKKEKKYIHQFNHLHIAIENLRKCIAINLKINYKPIILTVSVVALILNMLKKITFQKIIFTK